MRYIFFVIVLLFTNIVFAVDQETLDWIADLSSSDAYSREDLSWVDNLQQETHANLQENLSYVGENLQQKLDQHNPSIQIHNARMAAKPNLYVFISFSVPEQSLKALAQQVAKVEGNLVLRGLKDNNMIATQQHIQDIFGEQYADLILIDPMLYRQFNIDKVPAFVLTHDPIASCSKNSCDAPKHDVVYGNMPLESALQAFIQQGELPKLAQDLHRKVVT